MTTTPMLVLRLVQAGLATGLDILDRSLLTIERALLAPQPPHLIPRA